MSSSRAFSRMLATDLRYGARQTGGRFAAAFLLMVFLVTMFRFLTMGQDGGFGDASFTDCFASLFGGMSEYDPSHDSSFNVPASWLCVCLMGAFVVLSYPGQNLESIGAKQCIAAQSRWSWWLSKCVWTTVNVFLYWLLAVVVALLASTQAIHDGAGDLVLSQEAADALGFIAAADCDACLGTSRVLLFVAGVPFALAALCLVQLVVSVNLNPLVAFGLTASLLFHAAFYLTPMSLGNYLMLARSDLTVNNGVDAGLGIVLSVAVGIAAVAVGGKVFAGRDIVGKERYSA